ncbi:MAG: bactofilin family protein [Bacillota bacterium]
MGKKRKAKKLEEAKGKVETILGNGTAIEGDINTKGSLRIEGRVKGVIKAEGDLYIGESGVLHTQIEARNVIVAGTVNGNIIATEKIEILPSGRLNGDIQTKTIKIEEGASFAGESRPLESKKDMDISKKVEQEAAVAKENS